MLFDPFDIFERAGWACEYCGIGTPVILRGKVYRGKVHPRSPELDHFIPLGAGGLHHPDNCKCACRRCNAAKLKSDMRLILNQTGESNVSETN